MDNNNSEKDDNSSDQKKDVVSSLQKICLVCGDKALGYNFNAISCESCKAFFRRNALASKEFKCPFTNNCVITIVTRRFCQKCRLEKCLSIGMVKEFIMSDEDKAQKRKKIEENRARKRQIRDPDDAVSSSKTAKFDNESDNSYVPTSDNVVQYDTLSTTCSPSSTVQSPLSNEIDSSLQSPVYKDTSLPSPVYRETTLHSPVYKETATHSPVYKDSSIHSPVYKDSSIHSPVYKDSSVHSPVYKNSSIHSPVYKDSSIHSPVYKDSSTHSPVYKDSSIHSPVYKDSSIHSPVYKDSSIHSPVYKDTSTHSPAYNYPPPPIHHSEQQYMMKVYPIDEKSVINRAILEQRMMDSYMYENVDSNMCPDQQKQNSIRSILTNGETKAMYRDSRPEHMCEELPSTSSNPDVNKARDILQDVERIEPNSMESILCEAIKLEFEAYTSVNSCSGSSRELNEVERAKLNELIVANKALHAPIDDDVSQLVGDTACTAGLKAGEGKHDPRLITIVNITAVAIRRFIKMAKKINAFKNMCEEDQVALLKGGCIEMMVLRSTMTYDGQRNQWKLPHCQEQFAGIRTDILKLAKGNIYRTHESFIRSFDARWRTDEHVILIMCAILLFAPDRARVVHRDVIKLEQNSYYYLLRRYLESVYPGCEAKSTFLKLIQKILELRKLAEEVTGVYLDVNPIEPLLMEIFDLKHHAA